MTLATDKMMLAFEVPILVVVVRDPNSSANNASRSGAGERT